MLRKLSLGLVLILAACGSARVIQRTQTGGVIELQGDRGKAMEQANQEMASHCGPNNYTIVQEGEEAIGTDTYSRQDTSSGGQTNGRQYQEGSTTQGQQSTRTATAWRVHYQCNGAGGGPQPMPAAAPAPGAGAPPPPPPGPGY